MSLNWIRTFCLALPSVTEDVKWEKDLVFSIGAKMFAVKCLEPGPAHRRYHQYFQRL